MCTPFFPINNREDILNRKALIATYMNGVYVTDDMRAKDFMFLSETAYAIQEERKKAAENREGKGGMY